MKRRWVLILLSTIVVLSLGTGCSPAADLDENHLSESAAPMEESFAPETTIETASETREENTTAKETSVVYMTTEISPKD